MGALPDHLGRNRLRVIVLIRALASARVVSPIVSRISICEPFPSAVMTNDTST